MRSLVALLLVSWALAASAQAPKVTYLPNERFARQIGDIEPIQWKDYEPIQRDAYKCLDDKKLEAPVCKRVQERLDYALYDALSQAHVLNTLAQPGDPKFCDEYGRKLILSRKLGPAVAYTLLIVDERMKYGSSLYGTSLPTTYLGKIVHDSLMESQPCKP
jgi:hypothetical protein